MNKDALTENAGRSESPLRLRRRVRKVRAIARPYKIEVKRFSKFLVVGALGFVVDFGVFNLATNMFGVLPAAASFISLVCAIFSNFTFNYYWVYPDARSKSLAVQFVQFFLVSVSVALFRVPLIQLTHQPFGDFAESLLHVSPATATVLGNNAALVLTVGIGLVWNFTVNRLWTYRHAPRG